MKRHGIPLGSGASMELGALDFLSLGKGPQISKESIWSKASKQQQLAGRGTGCGELRAETLETEARAPGPQFPHL